MVQYRTALIQNYKEAKDTDVSIRKEILRVLSEIHSQPLMENQQQGQMPQNQDMGELS